MQLSGLGKKGKSRAAVCKSISKEKGRLALVRNKQLFALKALCVLMLNTRMRLLVFILTS